MLGLPFVRMRRFEISAFLAGTVYFVAIVTYAYVEGRFYIPILFLLVALAVLPAEWAVGQAVKGRVSIWGVGVLAVFLLSCIGYPSQSGFKPTEWSITSLGRSSLRKWQWKIPPIRGAEGIPSDLPRRTRHCFIRHRSSLFECATAKAICSSADRR